jgi:peptide/nickel transport system substrate-binding protein
MVLKRKSFLLLLIIILLISACQAGRSHQVDIPAKDQGLIPTSLPSPVPQKVLSICLGEEPRSLFIYGDLSTSARIIRQALYDWTIDEDLNAVSALLNEIPSQENGQVILSEIEVFPGERLVDTQGNLTILANGTKYRPSGCSDDSCAEVFENQDSIIMDQVRIEYKLISGISWSDGTAIDSADSVFSYQVASLIYGQGGPKKLRFSSGYEAGEDGEIYWMGLPGYQGIQSYGDLFFDPLPEHIWLNLDREELLSSFQSTIFPLAWGAYQVKEWVQGDHITLIPNDLNYQAQDGMPFYDALVFRFVNSAEEALAAFHAGECQLVTNQPGLDEFKVELLQGAEDGILQIYLGENKAWEQLSFGINSRDSKRTLLSDPDLRQVIAGCINREKISTSRLDADQIVDDFYPFDQSGINDMDPIDLYQPVESGLSLKEMGWIDQDGDPETPRLSDGIDGVVDGTTLEFILLAAEVDEPPTAMNEIRDGLRSCGIGVEIEFLPAGELLAPGPEGPIFGRDFDLAYFAWAAGNYQPCQLFISGEIPGLYPSYPKGWGGVNAAGYNNEEYDSFCMDVMTSLPDSDNYLNSIAEIRKIFRTELPALPLFFRREIIIADPDLIGLTNDSTALFWNIESLRR